MNNSQSPHRILCTPDIAHNALALSPSQSGSGLREEPTTPVTDIDVELLSEEQSKIDSSIKFLLNYNCKKRKPGRPSNQTLENLNSLKEPFKSLTDINDLHPGILLDYLTKVNNFNKKILGSLKLLAEKYDDLNKKIEHGTGTATATDTATGTGTESKIIPGSSAIHVDNSISNNNNNGSYNSASPLDLIKEENCRLMQKVDALEQKNNSNIIVISGNSLPLPERSDSDSDHFKSEVLNILIEKTNKIIEKEDIENVISINKDKKIYKIICKKPSVKRTVISYARKNKPTDLYVSEFLTAFRSKLFYEARTLWKNSRESIQSVYTREGNIFYKLINDPKFNQLRSMNDITTLKLKLEIDKTSSNALNEC